MYQTWEHNRVCYFRTFTFHTRLCLFIFVYIDYTNASLRSSTWSWWWKKRVFSGKFNSHSLVDKWLTNLEQNLFWVEASRVINSILFLPRSWRKASMYQRKYTNTATKLLSLQACLSTQYKINSLKLFLVLFHSFFSLSLIHSSQNLKISAWTAVKILCIEKRKIHNRYWQHGARECISFRLFFVYKHWVLRSLHNHLFLASYILFILFFLNEIDLISLIFA